MRTEIVTAKLLNPEDLLADKLGVKSGQQVGDLGCGGAGYFSLPAARLVGPNGKVYAVDVLKSALAGVLSKAKLENLLNIEAVWSDLEKVGATKVVPESLDHALLVNILFQSRQNESLVQEARRLLCAGGRLLVVDWKVATTPFGPPLANRLSAEAVKQLVSQFDFTVEKEFEAGPYHYGFVFVKQ
ncbi:MAG: methyltransferase domain-containing protein [Candidatus Kerfeldbacteria bacterium]|nr:methyltransferase domain-containing protein [Candidatus Kerfeldbacteria bacterium]